MIYLDNSATSFPKPRAVYEAYNNAIKYYHSNPGRGGYKNSLLTAEKIYEVREKTAAFFGEENCENIAFTANCTTAINVVIKGVLKDGDHAVISDLEHNAILRPLEKLRLQGKIKYDIFKTDFYRPANTLAGLRRCINERTKLVICTHASNVTGVTLPIAAIGKLCREQQIIFAVDAAQSGGILPLDKAEYHIDYLCLAPHKGLFAPMGLGVLIGDGSALDTLTEGGTGSLSSSAVQPDFMPDRLESGTMNVGAIIALGAGIDYIQNIGRENIYLKEKEHILQLHDSFKELQSVRSYVHYDKLEAFAPVYAFNIAGMPCETAAQKLSENGICVRAGLHCAPLAHQKIGTVDRGTIRISPSFFTTSKEINCTINTIKKFI
ncbi:MAG: aminotransferase class V-fold PLP-dependent enzyme [Ruminococcaceae bacterium]|nr:aminotransferase class V-fold PLP-dependent enzyme [Oscillospiraceae bacterium]